MLKSNQLVGQRGVAAVHRQIANMGWLFREQPSGDYGIDAQIEIVNPVDQATGRLLAVQIKAGPSYFREHTPDGIVFRGEARHLSYWSGHSLPVIVTLYDVETDTVYWQVVNNNTVQSTGTGWKVIVPYAQKLDLSSEKLLRAIADEPTYKREKAELALAMTWIALVADGHKVCLEVEEWENKVIARGSLRLFLPDVRDHHGDDFTMFAWTFIRVPGETWLDFFRRQFPWADVSVDEDFYERFDHDRYEQECGVWDAGSGSHLGTEDFSDWKQRQPTIRPYEVEAGELGKYRLVLCLSQVGKDFLTSEQYLGR